VFITFGSGEEHLVTKTAIITGGAGGIAAELAQRLLARDFRLLLLDLDEARLQERARILGGDVTCVTADLTQPRDLERAAALVGDIPELELLVNNAGIIEPGNVADLPYAVLERHVAINLLAPMRLTQAAVGGMIRRRSGCVLSIVSAAGVVALPGSAAYSASKFGLRGFLTALSQELVGHGVRVRSVFPGAVDTPMLRYEATHGGSPLNFLNKEVLTPAQVVAACMRAMDGNALETYLPFSDGITARIVGMAPGLIPLLLPHLQKKGESGMRRYLNSRGLKPGG
jgi:short-subunit dehydrogenase